MKVSMSRWARWSARAAYALGAVISLAGPGPRLLDAAPGAIVPAGNAVATHQVLLSGTAVQGPMAASTVTAYAVDSATGADLQVLGTAKTDASGNFTVKILSRVSPLRLAVTGGSFISEADGTTVAQPRRVTVLLPGATSDIAGISINPLTRFVNALTIGRLPGHITFAAALSNATATIESYYSLSTDPGRLLPDYTVSGVGTDAGKLGLILGALINEDQHLCPGKPGGLVTALAADIVSGVFNGRHAGLPVPYCGGELPAIAGTSDFQDALAGVQQLQYVSSGFAFGGLYGPAGNILFNQAPPVTPFDERGDGCLDGRPNANGKVLIMGDGFHINPDVSVAELYDPADNSMAERSFNTFRQFPSAALLPNGKVLIAGGFGGVNGQFVILTSTQIYDPSQDTFVDGPSMTVGRWVATAAPTANGKVLVIGGNGLGTNILNSVEVYDSVTNSFTTGAPMSDPRLFPTATLLPNGRVLIAGGWNGTNSLESTELYTP
jgi:hypothetical protein